VVVAALASAGACGDDIPSAGTSSDAESTSSDATESGVVSTTSGMGPGDDTADATTGDDGSDGSSTGDGGTPWVWDIPPQLPLPVVPDDNPMTVEKVALGRHLFYDTRLSFNETQSCASCHSQELGFADGEVTPTGSEGAVLVRNSPGLANVAYLSPLTWANPLLPQLEEQILVPLLGENPIELGVIGHEEEVLARLADDPMYQDLFAAAFPDEADPFSIASVARALASFCRSMISFDAPYDRYTYYDEPDALSASALRGAELFFSELLECHHCHGGFNFSIATVHEQTAFATNPFANTGVYNVDGAGAYPLGNQGLIESTFEAQDMGKFRSPPLRNISVTGPYLHDGTGATLEDVVGFYAAGGRVIDSGPNAGDGTANPFKSSFLSGFPLTLAERDDLIAFLESLTDEAFLEDPAFSNPWR
jgi:cytochrome c peroxidase